MATFEMEVTGDETENPVASPTAAPKQAAADAADAADAEPKETPKETPKHWGSRDERSKGLQLHTPASVVIPESVVEGMFQDVMYETLEKDMPGARTGKELWKILRVKLKMVVAADIYKELYKAVHSGLVEDGKDQEEENDMSELSAERVKSDWLEHMRSTEQECHNRRWFFHPNSPDRMWWDLGQVVMLAYVAAVVPIRAGFSVRVETLSMWFWIDLVTDIYFLGDIAVNFRTAYYDKRSANLIIDEKLIAKKYLKSWFVLDFVSCIPFGYIEMWKNRNNTGAPAQSSEAKLFKVMRLLRLAKMLRLSRLKGILERQDEAVGPMLQSFKLVGIICGICFVAHLFACMWYFVGEDDQYANGYWNRIDIASFSDNEKVGALVERGWVYYMEEEWFMNQLANMNHSSSEEALRSFELADPKIQAMGSVGWGQRYVASVYWAMTTLSTVGYGDFHARTQREMIFSIMVELAGGVSFAMLVGSLNAVLMSRSAGETIYNERMDSVREFLRVKEVPLECKRKVLSFYTHYYQEKTVFDEGDIIDKLPEYLQTNIIHCIYGTMVQEVPIFAGLDQHVVAQVCFALRPLRVVGGDAIMVKGERGNEMFLLVQGEVEVKNGSHSMGYLSPGAFFGELAVLNDDGLSGTDVLRTRTVEAVSDCDLVFLTKQDMHKIQSEYPALDAQLRKFMRLRKEHLQELKESRLALIFGDTAEALDKKSDGVREETTGPETWDLTTMVQKIQDLERNQEKVGETLAELQAQHQETVGVLSSVAHTLTQM